MISINAQKDDIERQVDRIKGYVREHGWEVQVLKDIGSGMNENRKNYHKLLELVVKGGYRRLSSLIQIG